MSKKQLDEILDYIQPTKYIVKSDQYNDNYIIPVLTAGKSFILGFTNELDNVYYASDTNPVILFDDFTTDIKLVTFPFKVKSSACKILVPRNGENIHYIYYAMKAIQFDNSLHKRYWISSYSKEKINFPSIETQNVIVREIKCIESLIEKNNKTNNLLNEMIKSRFNEMFDFSKNSDKKLLRDFCDVITKGTTPTTLGYQFIDKGINFVKIECITNEHTFLKEKFLHINEECNLKLKRSILKENDILFSIAGAIGRTAIVSKDILPANTNQALAIIRLKDNKFLNYKYLNYYLNSDDIKEQCESKKVGAAQINLSLTDIGNFKILIPELNQQNEFEKFVKLIDKSKFIQ